MVIRPNGEINQSTFYRVIQNLINSNNEEIDYSSIENAINESILMHTQSDVGYNIQLSGGLDSSYITSVLSTKFEKRLNTFSVELPGYDEDEKYYQSIV